MPVLIHLLIYLSYRTEKAAAMAKFFLLCGLCNLIISRSCSGGKQSSGMTDMDFLPQRASMREGSEQHKHNRVSKLQAFSLHLEDGGQVCLDAL